MEYANANGFPNPQFLWTTAIPGHVRPPRLQSYDGTGGSGECLYHPCERPFPAGQKTIALWVGILLEETFASYNVRYIAINDNVDTLNGVDDSVAVRDLLTSGMPETPAKKVKAVIMAAARRGERIGQGALRLSKKTGKP